jgi:hypothetical protein
MQVKACAGRKRSATVQNRRRRTDARAIRTLGAGQNQGEEMKISI